MRKLHQWCQPTPAKMKGKIWNKTQESQYQNTTGPWNQKIYLWRNPRDEGKCYWSARGERSKETVWRNHESIGKIHRRGVLEGSSLLQPPIKRFEHPTINITDTPKLKERQRGSKPKMPRECLMKHCTLFCSSRLFNQDYQWCLQMTLIR